MSVNKRVGGGGHKDITEPYWGLGQVNIMTGSKGTKKKDLKKKNY